MEEGEQNNVNTNGNVVTEENSNSGSSAGLIIGIIVILAIIIFGGLYFWSQRAGNDAATDKTVESINQQSGTDNTTSIESDLNSTDIENLDAGLNAS